MRLVRPRTGFRMVLHREYRQSPVFKTFQRPVVKIVMGELNILIFKRFRLYAESVVLGSNLNFAGSNILYRMIGSPVSEFEFICMAAKSQAKHLVPQADSENRKRVVVFGNMVNEFLNRVHHI